MVSAGPFMIPTLANWNACRFAPAADIEGYAIGNLAENPAASSSMPDATMRSSMPPLYCTCKPPTARPAGVSTWAMKVPLGGIVTCCVLLLVPVESRSSTAASTALAVEFVRATNR